MSNARKNAASAAPYRTGYLRSPAWFARRDRWFTEELALRGEIRCALCGGVADPGALELHHLSYDGVEQGPERWYAGEAHEDLTSLHARCHEWLHKLLDGDAALRRMRDRRLATRAALARLRAKLRRNLAEQTEQAATR